MSDFLDFLALQAASRLEKWLRPQIDSRTLANSMRTELLDEPGHAALSIPQYWAVYYHDGRGPVRPINGKFLVWFQNIEDDPRVANGYPTRASDIRPLALSPEEFKSLIESGKMVVRRSAGPAEAHPFFEKLAGRAQGLIAPIMQKELSRFVKAELGGLLKIRATARVR